MAFPFAHKRVVRRCSHLVRFFFFPLSLSFSFVDFLHMLATLPHVTSPLFTHCPFVSRCRRLFASSSSSSHPHRPPPPPAAHSTRSDPPTDLRAVCQNRAPAQSTVAFSGSPGMQHDVIGSPGRPHPFAHRPGVWDTTRHRPLHRVLPWEAGTHHWFGNPQPTLGGRGRAGVANDSGVVLRLY